MTDTSDDLELLDRRLGQGILAPGRDPRVALVRAAIVVGALAVLGFLLRWQPLDGGLSRRLNGARTGVVGSLSTTVYHLFSPAPAIALTVLATALVWWWSHRLRVAAAFAGTVAVTWIPSDVLKLVVDRPRPDVHLLPHPFLPSPADPSFPSGHTVFVTAFVLAVLLVVRGTALHHPIAIAGSIIVVIVALSLSVDAVHYPTDVLASVAWSVGVAPAARWVWVDVVLGRFAGRRTGSRRRG
ncbi:phosphatase PAP2 family protein [Lapillicoccus jejuensis]|uniref:Undecaprenyl-diphosphatase n=1 Tax=Lapillicoccus jejuensis TaxID=402171 RepID=A0A542DXM9_9MICO|nr:phosphatase PAP2 family protein [Lapillicoccus jejuensis]TQJ07839.1 undecaprenyl-diphosphatase [Lapillicoccus jejuensis]